MGSVISIDDWVPERPPKNPTLRIPSPDLPPPPVLEVDKILNDEPLPPPPEEVLSTPLLPVPAHPPPVVAPPTAAVRHTSRRNSFAGQASMYRSTGIDNLSNNNQQQPSPPPAVPRKPEIQRRSVSAGLQAHRVIITDSGGIEPVVQPKVPLKPSSIDIRMSVRKRPHNSVGIPLIADKVPPPAPPLKPRMPSNFR